MPIRTYKCMVIALHHLPPPSITRLHSVKDLLPITPTPTPVESSKTHVIYTRTEWRGEVEHREDKYGAIQSAKEIVYKNFQKL